MCACAGCAVALMSLAVVHVYGAACGETTRVCCPLRHMTLAWSVNKRVDT